MIEESGNYVRTLLAFRANAVKHTAEKVRMNVYVLLVVTMCFTIRLIILIVALPVTTQTLGALLTPSWRLHMFNDDRR